MPYQHLLVEKRAGYVVATINHPPANAISQGVLGDLDALLRELREADDVRAIVITGAGQKAFSAGADISELGSMQAGNKPKVDGHAVFMSIETYPKPIIAAMQGHALGGGLELAMSCHLRIMSASALAGMPEVKLGFTPGWGGTQRLPRLIGKTKALEMNITGEPITADEALRYGLVNKVVPRESVLPEAEALAAKLAQGAPVAIREIITAINKGLDTTLEEGMEIEESCHWVSFVSEDAREGAAAFLEKRQPRFTGK